MTSTQSDLSRATEPVTAQSNVDREDDRSSQRVGRGRRRFIRTAGGLVVAGLVAGCLDAGEGGDPDSNDGSPTVDEWLANADNYDSIADRTDESTVTVEVGPESNEMVFEPAAIRVASGTTVTWEWIGKGYHNVVARDDLFTSGSPEEGGIFEYTFESAGTTLYYCTPHRAAGMKGAVIVEDV